jgi:uroporphyrinogen decarboxylase
MILEFKLGLFDELHRRFGGRIHGIFLTDDWGTQEAPFAPIEVFEQFFQQRYGTLFGAVRAHGWHVILHSDGRINDLIPRFLDAGVNVLNLLQPLTVGIQEVGQQFAGAVCFLATPDIQATLPLNNRERIEEEACLLVKHWSTPEGGFIVSTCGDGQLLGMRPDMPEVMFRAFERLMYFWQPQRPS